MPLTYTYSYALNQSYPITDWTIGCKYTYWWIKAFLTGQLSYTDQAQTPIVAPPTGAWTCYGSSDGVTAGLDALDRWGSPFDDTKLVYGNGGGTPRSWIVLQSPVLKGANWYLYLELTGPVANANTLTIVFSKIAPVGPVTVNARPTAINEWNAFSAGSTTTVCLASSAALHTKRFQGALSSDGAFYIFTGVNGYPYWHLVFWPLEDTTAGDQYPVVSILYSQPDTTITSSYNRSPLSEFQLAIISGSSTQVKSRRADGLSSFYGGLVFPMMVNGYTSGQLTQPGTITNYNAAIWQFADTAITGMPRWPVFPFMVSGYYPGISSRQVYKGTLADIAGASGVLAGGAVAPATGTIEKTTIGPLWVPANDWITF